jgi:hypothetical protein
MKEIKTHFSQSIFDLAVQYYGSIDAVWNIIDDNNLSDGLDTDLTGGQILRIRTDVEFNTTAEYFSRFSQVINNSDYDVIPGIVTTIKIMLVSVVNESSGGDGSITIDVSGGVLPYSFEWRNQETNVVISSAQNLNAASGGIYKVKVTDAESNTAELQNITISVSDNNVYLVDDFGNIISDENGNPIVVN